MFRGISREKNTRLPGVIAIKPFVMAASRTISEINSCACALTRPRATLSFSPRTRINTVA